MYIKIYLETFCYSMKSLDKVVFKKIIMHLWFSFLNIYVCICVYIIQLLKKKKKKDWVLSTVTWDELCRPMKDSECWYIWVRECYTSGSTIIEKNYKPLRSKSLAALTIPLNFKGVKCVSEDNLLSSQHRFSFCSCKSIGISLSKAL